MASGVGRCTTLKHSCSKVPSATCCARVVQHGICGVPGSGGAGLHPWRVLQFKLHTTAP